MPSIPSAPCARWARRRPATALTAALLAGALSLPALAAPGREARGALRPRPLPAKSLLLAAGPTSDPRVLVVKLADDVAVEARAGRLQAESPAARPPFQKGGASEGLEREGQRVAAKVGAVFASVPGIAVERLIPVAKPLLDLLRRKGEVNTGEALADLSQYYRVSVPSGQGVTVLKQLLALPEVENAYAYREVRHPTDIAPATPDFLNLLPGQGYRNPAPQGIGVASAGTFTGTGVTIVDVEAGWNLAHEDLDHLLAQVPPVHGISPGFFPTVPAFDVQHGTASLGVLAAGQNGYGTAGLVPGAKIRVVPTTNLSQPGWQAPAAVVHATLLLKAGDVMLLEVEEGSGLPFETFDVEFSVVRQATALGIHVVEAAGNTPVSPAHPAGGVSLDSDPAVFHPVSGTTRFDTNFRDSGAILVGGGDSAVLGGIYHNRYISSNYGTRVDAYSWAQNVTTLGFGPMSTTLANCANAFNPFPAAGTDSRQWYTHCYNGTSSASAIVAGAVAILANKHAVKWGRPADPRAMRSHLRQGTLGGGGIGHQPDLAYHLSLFDAGGVISHSFLGEGRATTLQPLPLHGSSIAGPGDVDGDGLADIAIGAQEYSVDGSTSSGRVYLYSAKSERVLWKADGVATGDQFGHSLAALGDVNGDGIGDLAIGAPGDGFSNPGTVRVVSGADGTQLYSLTVGPPSERFGGVVGSAGADYNGDGAWELLVGVPGDVGNTTFQGRVELRSGRTGVLLWSRVDPTPGSELGFSVDGIGDLNGDGWSEVIAGAPRDKDPVTGQTLGAVYVLSGRTGKPFYSIKGQLNGTLDRSAFGASVSGTGDLNGDGLPDFVAGAPRWSLNLGGDHHGKVYIYAAAGTSATLLRTYQGAQNHEALGISVSGIGDFNGDGLFDIAVGQPAEIAPIFSTRPPGKVYVYLGPFDVPATPQLLRQTTKVFASKDPGTLYGHVVAGLGDTNGDGLADVGTGEPTYGLGRAFVFSSGPATAAAPTALLTADLPAIEAKDVDLNGFGGGGASPSSSRLRFDAGLAFANADYWIVAVPKAPFQFHPAAIFVANNYLVAGTGTLDASGQTTAPVFGPIPNLLPSIGSFFCPTLAGAEFDFYGVAGIDANNDGIYEQQLTSNPATVQIITEYTPQC